MANEPETGKDTFTVNEIVASYNVGATELASTYEKVSFADVHAPIMDLLPKSPGCILDVGAGSGRDAAWFVGQGHQVIAVEPSRELRSLGQTLHGTAAIQWIDDTLPGLSGVLRSKLSFDLVWVSAVWMHVPPSARTRAFRKLVSVLSPGGSMMVSLRQGPPPANRPMATATRAEIETLARRNGLRVVRALRQDDVGGRLGISWDVVWLQLPDDGTGALPLLRHVVFNDRKSSTYKLALLRTLIRIADGAAGLARESPDEQHIDLPLGLVALYWIRAFHPLIAAGLPQHPAGNNKLAFAKAPFQGLGSRSPYDLRIGQSFTGMDAVNLVGALRDAAKCIRQMPATYITYPGSTSPVFPFKRGRTIRARDSIRIDEAFLWSFGTLSVPTNLWQSMSHYAPWVEPAVVNEWVQIMRGYESVQMSWDVHMAALRWLDPEHDTGLVRTVVQHLRQTGQAPRCVWTGNPLGGGFDVDHCFPFAAWPCNDLWNLMPSSAAVNRTKGDRLPAPETLELARSRILDWWQRAYLDDEILASRFVDEISSALPISTNRGLDPSPDSLFEGVMVQQMVLKRDQQLAEWAP